MHTLRKIDTANLESMNQIDLFIRYSGIYAGIMQIKIPYIYDSINFFRDFQEAFDKAIFR